MSSSAGGAARRRLRVDDLRLLGVVLRLLLRRPLLVLVVVHASGDGRRRPCHHCRAGHAADQAASAPSHVGCPLVVRQSSPAARAASHRSKGIRPPSSTTPPEDRRASANSAAQRSSQIIRAADELGSSACGGVLHVLGGEQAAGIPPDVEERLQLVDLVDLDGADVAVGVLHDEQQVAQPDQALVHEVGQRRGERAVELVAGEAEDHVLGGCCSWSSSRLSVVVLYDLIRAQHRSVTRTRVKTATEAAGPVSR